MSSSSSKSKSFSRNASDWTCPDKTCGNVNFARRDQCNRCDAEKPQSSSDSKSKYNAIGNAAAKNSRGLFSPEDWSCMKCGNINWARRSTCNICNAKKFADEERTGYGGGYNERGNVEYKNRESSDSEYDEFGRRKKKQSNSKKSVSSKSSREARRSRSRSSSRTTSSSDRSERRKRSRRSRSPKRSRRRSSSSSRSRERKKKDNKTSPRMKEIPKEKSPENVHDDEEDDEESGDEDLSKYDLFDDDFNIETFKRN